MEMTKRRVAVMARFAEPESIIEEVLNDILSEYDEGGHEAAECYIKDVLQYGCQTGTVSGLIYYNDTTAFFERHKKEIIGMLKEFMSDTGVKSPSELFGDKWDDEDYFADDVQNQNLLAWFGYEETLRKVASEFEDFEEYI